MNAAILVCGSLLNGESTICADEIIRFVYRPFEGKNLHWRRWDVNSESTFDMPGGLFDTNALLVGENSRHVMALDEFT